MAQQKKTSSAKKNTSNARNKKGSKSNARNSRQQTLFSPNHRVTANIISIFFAIFMLLVVFIEGGSVWGALRNFFFGVYGCVAFVVPFFIIFTAFMSLIKKDTTHYKHRVIECFVVFVLAIALCHLVNADATLTYGEQITEAYNVFKSYNGEGLMYGFGVFGAVFGALPFLLTGGSKLAAGAILVLLLVALTVLFFGTTIIRLASALRKPAGAVSDYAGEKYDDFRAAYDTVSVDAKKKRQKKAEKRHKKKEEAEVTQEEPDEELVQEYDGEGESAYTNYDKAANLMFESLKEQRAKMNKATPEAPDTDDYPVADDLFGFNTDDEAPEEPDDDEHTVTAADVFTQPESVNDVEGESQYDEYEDEDEADADADADEDEAELLRVAAAEPAKYELPPIDCLSLPSGNSSANNEEELRRKSETIVNTLKSFGVGTRIVEICQSPTVTRFELQPDPGVKISRITNLADDIAMNLAASGVRIEAPIPNKNAVGIEVPNAVKATVTLREIIESNTYRGAKSKLNVALGRDIQGVATCADLAKMPHLLVAGTTGSGKSVCLNTMIMSLLYNATPDEVKLIMIDPKKVEFTVYRSIPHLLVPVVSDARKAAAALSWAVAEMDKRYALFADKGARNLQGYNKYAAEEGLALVPQIVIIIDELADLMMAASKEVEDSICRLAQKARAAGMHLIVATQRPSVDVITGLIKSNIPSRIAFAVKSQIDSRTIIDAPGAEQLLGNGDMLYCPVGLSKPVRVQGSYVSDEEIERVIEFVSSQGEAKYDDAVMKEIELKSVQDGTKKKSSGDVGDANNLGYDDELFPDAVDLIIELGSCSTTMIQRKLKLGYSRAGRITDELYEKGFIGPPEGAKSRKVLITKEQWEQIKNNPVNIVPKQLTIDDMPVKEEASQTTNKGCEPNYFGSAVNDTNYDVEDE